MTPLECAEGIAEFLKEKFTTYQEYCEGRPENIFSSVDTDVNVYAGFLPRANNRADQKKLWPSWYGQKLRQTTGISPLRLSSSTRPFTMKI